MTGEDSDRLETRGVAPLPISPSLDPRTLAQKEVRPHRNVMQIARRNLIRQMMQTSLLQDKLTKHANEPIAKNTTINSSNFPPVDSKDTETTSPATAEIEAPSDSLKDKKDNVPSPIRKRPAAKSFLRMIQGQQIPARGNIAAKAPIERENVTKKSPKKLLSSPREREQPRKKEKAVRKKEQPKRKEKAVKASKPKDKLIFEGKPDEKIDGGWPEGWIKRTYERQSGATKGRGDRYWYTPQKSYKLRSILEVKRFLKALAETGGDEDEAKKIFKRIVV